MAKILPQLNDWYQDVEDDALFEIVAIDEQEGYIEVQYVNGEIGEFDSDIWEQMIILKAQPPEDWRAAYEIADDNQASDGTAAFSMANWDDPVAHVDPEAQLGVEDS
ncbi:MAG: hypothetical protein KUG71_04785 [Porticoccaceae bacterium]|nr:hypothetical protein [Porticoccaceae bacterium]